MKKRLRNNHYKDMKLPPVYRSCYLPWVIVFTLVFSGCTKDITELDKYQSPDWMKGKISTQIREHANLGTFMSILEHTGYDDILNTSGSFTVFAPTDDAFDRFFQDHPLYKAALESDSASAELVQLAEYQIIYNAWSKKQFMSVDVNGWIDPEDPLMEHRGNKRQTLLREENKEYPVRLRGNKYQIVEPSESGIRKKAYTRSNKFCPVFFQDYLNVYDLSASDYQFYFERDLTPGEFYFAGAMMGEEIPAENGFVYKTDRVVLPLPNGEEIMETGSGKYQYTKILNLFHQFSEFSLNLEATNQQPGAEQGLKVDNLYDLDYPELTFNIHNELTGNTSNPDNTIREHHGLMVPVDEAMESFVEDFLAGWGDVNDLPRGIQEIIANSHMSKRAIYPTDIHAGFLNGEGDSVMLEESAIIQKAFGSNCSFLGLNKVIVPRAFTSVSRPLYLTRSFETMMYACEQTKVLSALKKSNANYTFYVPWDQGIGMGGDSSLVRIVENVELNKYHFKTFDMGKRTFEIMKINNLRKKILNQIAESPPMGIADKEFIRNLGGNYIIVDNTTGVVTGTAPSTFGNNGTDVIDLVPEPYMEETDNGRSYRVDTWFNFLKNRSYYGVFVSEYPEFLSLLEKAGLYNPSYYDFPFLTEGEFYTLFIPSTEALDAYGADTLSREELSALLKYHFVEGSLVFTDGRMPEGHYATTRLDESSTPFLTKYSTLHLRPDPDVIHILDSHGDEYLAIGEEEGETNKFIIHNTGGVGGAQWDFITTGVIHNIDKVLLKDSLQAN